MAAHSELRSSSRELDVMSLRERFLEGARGTTVSSLGGRDRGTVDGVFVRRGSLGPRRD